MSNNSKEWLRTSVSHSKPWLWSVCAWAFGQASCRLSELERAAIDSGVGRLGAHAFRHTYRSWLDAVGTPIAVQQKLMRHSDIRTTMNIYGSVVTDGMEKATSRVAGLALIFGDFRRL